MIKKASIVFALTVLCMGTLFTLRAEEKRGVQSIDTLSEQDRHALEVGRKVIRIRSALQHPEKRESIDAVKALGRDTRYYVMVRGWLLQEINSTESQKGLSSYTTSEEYKNKIDNRITALRKTMRAIDLE